MAHMSQPAGQQLALMTSHPGLWGVSQSNTAGVLPGVHFFGTEFENLRSVSEAASAQSSHGRKRISSEPDVEPDDPAETPRSSTAPPPPTWSPGRPPAQSACAGIASDVGVGLNPKQFTQAEVTPLLEGARVPAFPPPSMSPPNFQHGKQDKTRPADPDDVTHDVSRRRMSAEEQEIRARNQTGLRNIMMGLEQSNATASMSLLGSNHGAIRIVQSDTGSMAQDSTSRSNLLAPYGSGSAAGSRSSSTAGKGGGMFPWWESESQAKNNAATTGMSYHLRTRSKNGAVGLLIDPGAHDNLVGSITAEQMCEQTGLPLEEQTQQTMDRALPVEGVGKDAQVARRAIRLSMSVHDVSGNASSATYTAPQIEGSLLPPLLGNKTLRKMQSLIDCGSGRLVLPGPAGVELKLSPGSHVYDLKFTPSGHWILPIHPRKQNDPTPSHSEPESFRAGIAVQHVRQAGSFPVTISSSAGW